MWRRIWSNSIKNRLTFLFFSITAGAICVIYFYVVPQLESSLTSQRLDGLERDSVTYSRPLQQTGARDVLASKLKSVVRTLSEKSGSRVTLLGIPRGRAGSRSRRRCAAVRDHRLAGGRHHARPVLCARA